MANDAMEPLSSAAIQSALRTSLIGRSVLHYHVVDSTNDIARSEGRAGAPEGLVVVAEEQVAGRGRLQRPWLAPPGSSLLVSVLLRPSLAHLPRLTIIAALAVARTVEAVAGLPPALKWHNDVLVNGRKVCGILVESEMVGGQPSLAVVGIGLNVNFDPSSIPEIADTATSLRKEAGREMPRLPLLVGLLEELEGLYLALRRGEQERILAAWRDRLTTLGQPVRVSFAQGGTEEGLAEGVDEEGRLLLRRADGSVFTVVAGDVTLRPRES